MDFEEGYTLFWRSQSPFSQWHPAHFTINNITYNCAEQYMMHQKALHFKDFEIAKEILMERDPWHQKCLGKKVRNFDEIEWNKVSHLVVKRGSLEKYRQNADLRWELFVTARSVLVEASKYDCHWGIGSTKDDRMSWRCRTWRGYNWLGNILTETRDTLMKEFSEECDIQCSRYREQSGISWRAFARPESPFHMFYPAAITMNGMEFTSAGQYMLCKHAELIEDEALIREIMETKEQEQLLALWQKITLGNGLVRQWFHGLKRILHESNSAKFNSSNELWLKLFNTGSDQLVYAGEETPLGIDYRNYLDSGWLDNENWLGGALMSVREKLDKHSIKMPLGTEMARGKKRRKNKMRNGKNRRMKQQKRLKRKLKAVSVESRKSCQFSSVASLSH